MQVRLSLSELRVDYDSSTALKIDALELQSNITAILGHNGAGKSTLIKTILGLLAPKHGTCQVVEVSPSSHRHLLPERDMAFCPESGAVFEDISVDEYVRLWCHIKHRDRKYHLNEGRRIIELLEVSPLLKKLGRELSKGQRRRVQTAIGFLLKPRLFLFDEPFDGLDVQKTTELTEIIEEFSEHTAFFISSHRMDVMERLADQFLVLENGKIAASGELEAITGTLCGHSYLLQNISDVAKVHQLMKLHYRSDTISQIGDNLIVSGPQISIEKLRSQLAGYGPISITATSPSLTDAMHFHLKQNKIGYATQNVA